MNEEESVEEYCGGVCCKVKKAPAVGSEERESERESNKDKSRLMAVQEKV